MEKSIVRASEKNVSIFIVLSSENYSGKEIILIMRVRSTMIIPLHWALSFSRKPVFSCWLIESHESTNFRWFVTPGQLYGTSPIVIEDPSVNRWCVTTSPRPLRIRPVGNVVVKQTPGSFTPPWGADTGCHKGRRTKNPNSWYVRRVYDQLPKKGGEWNLRYRKRRWPFLAGSINGICLDRCRDAFTKIDFSLFKKLTFFN